MRELRSPLRRSFDRALLALLVAGLLFVVLLVALLPSGGSMDIARILFPSALVVYLIAGLLSWYYRPSNRMGALLLLAGVGIFLTGAENTTVPLFVALGVVGGSLTLAVLIHLLLAFPSGRLHGKVSQITVAAGYFTALVLQAPRYLFIPHPSFSTSSLWDAPWVAEFAASAQTLIGGLVFIVTGVQLVFRLKRASTAERRVLVPLYFYGIFAIAVLFFATRLLGAFLSWPADAVGILQLTVIALVPVAFALAVLRGGVARTGELEELGAWLGAAGDEKPAIAGALARTLGDPTIEVWFWVSSRAIYVDAQGVEVGVEPEVSRGTEVVELDGRRIGAISYDRALMPEPELARTAGRVVAIALDRERLTAELRASRRALQLSRERLVEAADHERRRIAQDLHDGLQVQLVLLALDAQRLARALGPGEGLSLSQRATALREGIDSAAVELRELVHSVMPAALIQRGLSLPPKTSSIGCRSLPHCISTSSMVTARRLWRASPILWSPRRSLTPSNTRMLVPST
ncbi:hypothetical protein DC31_02350 [Microbacterium sp. CH12i]|uniref:histidine kinase n=1 Tax=Microbacterium sp. CH12i TaxID=1479651 RepID=UPI00046116B8|nr:histidine kinase [Microbacterium sp. CH12i]KDA05232.1 hypothetical protein DC31_02350 [Microbacterium sp. CH12i]